VSDSASGRPLPATRGSVWTFLTTQAFSSVGALALTTVLGKTVFDLTDRELDLGILGLVEFLPALILVLITGTVADRFDRRRIASIAIFFEAVAAASLAWYVSTDPTSVTPIFLLVLVFGIARAFASPSMRSMPADLVPHVNLPWLTVRYSATWQLSAIFGPVIGGVLYAVDPVLPFLAVAGLFVASAVGINTVRYAPHARPPGRHNREQLAVGVVESLDAIEPAELIDAPDPEGGATGKPEESRIHEALEGFRFIRGQPVLLGAITLDLMAVLFGGAIALLPAIAEDRLGVGAVGLGWLRAATGIGAAIMTVGLAIRPVRRHIGVILLIAVAAFGIGTVALGVTTSFAVAFLALALLSAADAISVYIRATLVPLVTPDAMRGRVLAVEMVLIGASNELGAFESGVTGQLFGPAIAIVFGGAASVVVAIAWWFGFPDLRKLDRFPGFESGSPSVPEPAKPG
jgi:predicted MFS family arabinose efflux permease